MRTRLFVPTLLAAAVLAPTAHAAVPQDVSGAYIPADGMELLAAVRSIHSLPSRTGVIKLSGTIGASSANTYLVAQTIHLLPADHIEIREADEAVTAGSGYTPPSISSTTGIALIDAAGAGNLVRGVSITSPAVNTSDTYSLVTLGAGATLGSAAHVADGVGVTGTPGAPNVTMISAAGPATAIVRTTALNPATTAPTIRSSGGVAIDQSFAFGGSPAIDIDGSVAGAMAAPTTVDRTTVATSGSGVAAIGIHGGSGATVARISSSELSTFSTATTLVAVDGATSTAGTVTATINNSNLFGVAPGSGAAAAGTAVRVTPGSEKTATQVSLLGVYAPDTAIALACAAGGSTPATVTIQGIWRSGSVPTSGSACAVSETGHAVGDPLIDGTTYVPAWNSPLVDRAPATAAGVLDIDGNPRSSTSPTSPAATPTDIGAHEYQYVAPALTASSNPTDHLGTVAFTASATDKEDLVTDAGVTPVSVITWQFPGGVTATGAAATFTFASQAPGPITVTATSPTGMATSLQLTPAPDRSGAPITPLAPANPGGSGQVVLPTTVTLPTPTPTPPAAPAAAATKSVPKAATQSTPLTALLSFQLVKSKISRSARKASGIGKPASSEAGIAVTLASPSTLTVVARTQKGTKYAAVAGARFVVSAKAGATTLRLSSAIGKSKLKPGLYRFTLLVTPTAGTAERRDFSIRVK